jgi:hypothetical protein
MCKFILFCSADRTARFSKKVGSFPAHHTRLFCMHWDAPKSNHTNGTLQ